MANKIQYLHENFPIQMAKLYVKYGQGHQRLNIQTTEDLATVYGNDFLDDIEDACSFEGDSFFGKKLFNRKKKGDAPMVDEDGHPLTEEGDRSGSADDKKIKRQAFFAKAKDFGGKAFAFIKANRGEQGTSREDNSGDGRTASDDKIFGMSKGLFYGLVAVALILIVYAVSTSKKPA